MIDLVVYHESVHGYTGAGTFNEYRRQASISAAEDYLTGIQERFKEKDISTDQRVSLDPSDSTITTIVNEEKADLIAMASHGRTGLSFVFYGSVAAGVLHRVDRPLLLIRAAK